MAAIKILCLCGRLSTELCISHPTDHIVTVPGLHSHLGYSSRLLARCEWDEVRTNVDIRTLVRELSITRHNIRDILVSFDWLGTDLLSCFQELRDETRTGRECRRRDDCTLHTLSFSSCLVLSQWECKPAIRYYEQHVALHVLKFLFFILFYPKL